MKIKRITQTGVLLLMLGAPVLVFVTLYLFGENHYDLPYEGRYELKAPGDTLPLPLPESQLPWLSRGKVHIVRLKATAPSPATEAQWQRLQVYFRTNKTVMLHDIAPDSLHLSYLSPWHDYRQQPFVLVDKQGYVRGHYGSDMEEYDRLITETLIAVKLP
ncbi:hypothetical protein FHS56_000703 [Thermonema lapsum]|uniref:Uncharacterized protein n=1 Tax=Thermonema lapsum TaxID=28195 RepID=A0A846MPG9_9BACT|nr:hypothetical protein [Thermonema lapsum]NIK73217.1 hypothetical protein [Thermonema lapsum]